MGLYTRITLLQQSGQFRWAKCMAHRQLCFCGLSGSKPFFFSYDRTLESFAAGIHEKSLQSRIPIGNYGTLRG
jgi:hypothetical protein